MNPSTTDRKTSVDHRVVFSLTVVIMTCVLSAVIVTFATVVVDANNAVDTRYPYEVVTMLGQIASAGIGALAGYFTARIVDRKYKEDTDES